MKQPPLSPLYRHGQIWPLGIPVSLSWAEIGAIFALIQDFRIKTFVELGIENGGLGSLMQAREKRELQFRYFGVEKFISKIDSAIYLDHVYSGDLFEPSAMEFLLKVFERNSPPFLIFCDNGDKPREVAMISKLDLDGLILVHDVGKEFQMSDVPENMILVAHPWLPGTRLALMRRR